MYEGSNNTSQMFCFLTQCLQDKTLGKCHIDVAEVEGVLLVKNWEFELELQMSKVFFLDKAEIKTIFELENKPRMA